jgi:osmoprotectant transport system permease protein
MLTTVTALLLAWRFGMLDRFSPYLELKSQGPRFMQELWRHIFLSLSAFAFALVSGVAGAVLLSRGRRAGRLLGNVAGIIQNIPSLALFGLLLPAMAALATAFPVLRTAGISGIGFAPAFLALTAYALLPVMLSGAAGLRMVDAGARDAARGMGMSAAQVLVKVELPLALPAIAAGARTALVQTIGTTTVAALIGAGGMGYFVFQGVGQAAMDMVIIGVVPIVALSVSADALMAALGRRLATKGGSSWH